MEQMKQGRAVLARVWHRRAGTWWWAIAVIVVPVAAIAASAVTVLLMSVSSGSPQNQIELIKTGLTVGAGTGGIVALVLAGRRQWATERDSTERRLTELYLKAVEQLGSDKSAIRHGGLYALERVAQDNPAQRQTVVNVICAYLRNPYLPAVPLTGSRRLGARRAPRPAPSGDLPLRARMSVTVPSPSSATTAEAWQEREVRLTAQHILAHHLRPGEDDDHPLDTFWPVIDLDLARARLIDFDLSEAQVRTARFGGTTFEGRADFAGTRFDAEAWFSRTRFAGDARFDNADFSGAVVFEETIFDGYAAFTGAAFGQFSVFGGVIFAGHALFDNVTFGLDFLFGEAEFAHGVPGPLAGRSLGGPGANTQSATE
jgi:hypothetical protein